MAAHPVRRPADLDVVRESYDRAADAYVEMVATTGLDWLPEQLAALLEQAGLTLEADLRLPDPGPVGGGVVLVAAAPPDGS